MSERASTRHATPHSQRFAAFTGPQSKVPRVLGLLTYLIGIGDIITGLRRGLGTRFHPIAEVLPGSVANAASAAPVVAGILLSYALRPMVSGLERWRVPRIAAAALVMSILVAALSAIGYAIRDDVNAAIAEKRKTKEKC